MEQQQLGFVDRDELIATICLPKSITVKDGGVKSRVVRAVLFRLNQYIGNKRETFVGQSRIAKETEYSETTIGRAVEALKALGLVTVTLKKSSRSRTVLNHYSVNWDRVCELAQVQTHPELVDDQPEQVPTDPPTMGDRSPLTDPPFSPTDPPFSPTDPPFSPTDPPSDGGRPLGQEGQVKDSMKSDGVLENEKWKGVKLKPGAIKRKLNISDLVDPEVIDDLWSDLILSASMPDTEFWRETFFGLCYSIWRNRGKFQNPPGMLIQKLRDGGEAILEQVTDDPDRKWASKAIREFDGRELPRVSNLQEPDDGKDEKRQELRERVFAMLGERVNDLPGESMELLLSRPEVWWRENSKLLRSVVLSSKSVGAE